MSTRKKRKKIQFFIICDGSGIPQNFGERAIGMLNAGMTMNAVALNIRCSTRVIRHIRQRFQATGRKEDRPRSGQDRYIRNSHLRNRFQTATATVANTHGSHNNRISAQTVLGRGWANCMSSICLYYSCATSPHKSC